MNIARIRKALAAFILPLLGLPIGEWIAGNAVFDAATVWTTLGTALVAAISVYMVPNKDATG